MEQGRMAKRLEKEGQKTVRTGSKVVCVDDRFPTEILIYYNALPLKDRTYAVRDLGVGISANGEPGEIVVYLSELKNPCSAKPPHPERGLRHGVFVKSNHPPRPRSKPRSLSRPEQKSRRNPNGTNTNQQRKKHRHGA